LSCASPDLATLFIDVAWVSLAGGTLSGHLTLPLSVTCLADTPPPELCAERRLHAQRHQQQDGARGRQEEQRPILPDLPARGCVERGRKGTLGVDSGAEVSKVVRQIADELQSPAMSATEVFLEGVEKQKAT
jgi:hypothetical protein